MERKSKLLKVRVLLVFIIFSFNIYAQSDTIKVKNTTYFEFLGSGGLGSINFERILISKNRFEFSPRIGFGVIHFKDYLNDFNPDFVIPLSFHVTYGNQHKAEFGIGQSISSIIKANLITFKPKRTIKYSTIFNLGYRYQKHTKGLFLRISYTPIIEFNQQFKHWGGLSIGYNF